MFSLLLLVMPTFAAQTLTGDAIAIAYDDNGLWNDPNTSAGLQISTDGILFADITWPGNPWQQITFEYSDGLTDYYYGGNTGGADWLTLSEQNLSAGSTLSARYTYQAGTLQITRTDTWDQAGQTVLIEWSLTNTGITTLENIRVMHAMEPDIDSTFYSGTYGSSNAKQTLNDVLDLDHDGYSDWVQSVGRYSGWTVGYGFCDAQNETGGHTLNWSDDADDSFVDLGNARGDAAMHWVHFSSDLAPGASDAFSVVLVWDTTEAGAQSLYENALPACGGCDGDNDGYTSVACGGNDCDDTDAGINPQGQEVCDGQDNDCDGLTDDADGSLDGSSTVTWYADSDTDGYGDATQTQQACSQPSGYVANNTDCNDIFRSAYPGATEYCNGRDDNCDGVTDEDTAADATTWYADNDSDGVGAGVGTQACTQPSGTVSVSGDCDDTTNTVSPNVVEACDGVDNDCDGLSDEAGSTGASTWYADSDNDGYGDPAQTVSACDQPTGYTANSSDCNDSTSAIAPSAAEVCDGIDNDCDGSVDVGASDATLWYLDSDNDAFGDTATSMLACAQPSGYVADNTDCNDLIASAYPGAVELCNGYDDDCDGSSDEADAADASAWYADNDGDSFGGAYVETACIQPTGAVADNTDCDDSQSSVHPDAPEITDSLDNDCDGTVDNAIDSDGDGLTDGDEVATYNTDPTLPDTDGDGLEDGEEVNTFATNPTEPDSDGDGLDDGAEVNTHGTNPTEVDTDHDGLEDGEEIGTYQTNPTDPDTDAGGILDGAEVDAGTDPLDGGDDLDSADDDGDGLTNGEEEAAGTDPTKADTDNDGLGDGDEINVHGTNPLNPDSDGDGLEDQEELDRGTNPNQADTDGGGVSDGEEVESGGDPLNPEDDAGEGWYQGGVGCDSSGGSGLGAAGLLVGALLIRRKA